MVRNKELKELLGRKFCTSCKHSYWINYHDMKMTTFQCTTIAGILNRDVEAEGCGFYEAGN